MTLKRMMLAVFVAAVAITPMARAQTDVPGCADNFISGTPCQGPDADPAANRCEITTWVVKASCELTVPGGVTGLANLNVLSISAEPDQSPGYNLKLIVPSTGEVLAQMGRQGAGHPGSVCDGGILFCFQVGPWKEIGGDNSGSVTPQRSTTTVICEMESTWTKYGAPFAPLAEASALAANAGRDNVSPFVPAIHYPANNVFACSIS